ncbi:hypothetical protein MBMB1_1862 [Methanobacterium sp. MB1]|nr:hypothetical protein MBMB1_1862 [Methanobacterium sp. MB1]
MAKIQDLLAGKNERIDFDSIINDNPWIVEENKNCILSPDSDGLLCGLLMSHLLDWKIKGFYDGKILLLEKGLSAKDCIFLDMEIFREDVRSFGHHMLLYNVNDIPSNWSQFKNSIQPNNLRGYDGCHFFRLKYPLGTIHMLLSIVAHYHDVEIPEEAIAPLFFVDGTFNVLFKYPENVMNWLKYLRADEDDSPLKTVFMGEKYSVYGMMLEMDEFFRKRDEISVPKERGDRLRISVKDGSPFNIIKESDGTYSLKDDPVERIKNFINILSQFTGWEFLERNWCWNGFDLFKFTKRDFKADSNNVNGTNFNELMLKNPLSWAMTSGQNIEYTLEEPDKLP